MINVRLVGFSFIKLPYLEGGEKVIVMWDKENKFDAHAYSVRLEGLHIGWIPKVATLKEEALKARDGFRKVGSGKFEFVGKEEMRKFANSKLEECSIVEYVRDQLYTDFTRNHLIPEGTLSVMFWD